MVVIEVAVTTGPDKVADFEVALLRQHMRQERVACNIKRHTQENIAGALIELAGEFPVGHINLEHHMAGRQSHLGQLGHIPCRYDHTARIRIGFDRVIVGASPVSPLNTVNRS